MGAAAARAAAAVDARHATGDDDKVTRHAAGAAGAARVIVALGEAAGAIAARAAGSRIAAENIVCRKIEAAGVRDIDGACRRSAGAATIAQPVGSGTAGA